MLEDMEELFRIEANAHCCGCIPEWKTGLLGLRVLREEQKSLNRIVATSATGRVGDDSMQCNAM